MSSRCGSGRGMGGRYHQTTLTRVEAVETVLETFFECYTAYQFDRAREYIEREREQFRCAVGPGGHSTILATLLHGLAQLAIADKNYLSLQFFASKVFTRKDLVKSTYDGLRHEFQRLEDRGSHLAQLFKVPSSVNSPQHLTIPTSSSGGGANSSHSSDGLGDEDSEVAQDVLTCTLEEICQTDGSKSSGLNLSSSYSKDDTGTSGRSSSGGFFSKIFSFAKHSTNSSSSRSILIESSTPEIVTQLDENCNSPRTTIITTEETSSPNLESVERYASHLAGQLVAYCRVRVELVDLYERLAMPTSHQTTATPTSATSSSTKFCLVDECLAFLLEIQRNAERAFHHPVLTRLKTMFMLECDVMVSLLQAHIAIQQWHYLESLFALQEASSKLTSLAIAREYCQQMVASSARMTPNPSSSNLLKRNLVSSSSLSSSGGSATTLALVPPPATPAVSANHSPLSSITTFAFPSAPSLTAQHNSNAAKLFQKALPNLPALIHWLHRYKLFLLSKYTFYFFHPLLSNFTASSSGFNFNSLTGSSIGTYQTGILPHYAQMEPIYRQHLGKQLSVDFHGKIVQFLKKCDQTHVLLVLDRHNRSEISTKGYRSPYSKKEVPKGMDSFPIIYSYPTEYPKNRLPSLIMIINDKYRELNLNDIPVMELDKPSDTHIGIDQMGTPTSAAGGFLPRRGNSVHSSPSATGHLSTLPTVAYHLVRPDPFFTLVVACETKRADLQYINAFLSEMCLLLKGTRVLASLRTGK